MSLFGEGGIHPDRPIRTTDTKVTGEKRKRSSKEQIEYERSTKRRKIGSKKPAPYFKGALFLKAIKLTKGDLTKQELLLLRDSQTRDQLVTNAIQIVGKNNSRKLTALLFNISKVLDEKIQDFGNLPKNMSPEISYYRNKIYISSEGARTEKINRMEERITRNLVLEYQSLVKIDKILNDNTHKITKSLGNYNNHQMSSIRKGKLCDIFVLNLYFDSTLSAQNKQVLVNKKLHQDLRSAVMKRFEVLNTIKSLLKVKPKISIHDKDNFIDVCFKTTYVKNGLGESIQVTTDSLAVVKKISGSASKNEMTEKKRDYLRQEMTRLDRKGVKDNMGHIIARGFMGKNAKLADIVNNIFPENIRRNSDFSGIEGAIVRDIKIGDVDVYIYVHLKYNKSRTIARPSHVQRFFFGLDKKGRPKTTSKDNFSLDPSEIKN